MFRDEVQHCLHDSHRIHPQFLQILPRLGRRQGLRTRGHIEGEEIRGLIHLGPVQVGELRSQTDTPTLHAEQSLPVLTSVGNFSYGKKTAHPLFGEGEVMYKYR